VGNQGLDDACQHLPGDGLEAVEALLTGGDPRSLRNAGIVIDLASCQPERLEELVQCVFSADEVVRMRASDALEKVCPSSTASRHLPSHREDPGGSKHQRTRDLVDKPRTNDLWPLDSAETVLRLWPLDRACADSDNRQS
jgi:hypothetical protein